MSSAHFVVRDSLRNRPRRPARPVGRATRLLAIVGIGALTSGVGSAVVTAQAVPAVDQCNDIDNVAGQELQCDVTVVNEINIATGVTASTLTTRVCRGAVGETICTNTSTTSAEMAVSVTQCNGSGNGGGGTMRVQCDVLPSTQSPALPVVIDQCNGSANGGGDLVTCTASITNNIVTGPTDTTPGDTTPGGGQPTVTVRGGGTIPNTGGTSRTASAVIGGALLIAGAVVVTIARRRRTAAGT